MAKMNMNCPRCGANWRIEEISITSVSRNGNKPMLAVCTFSLSNWMPFYCSSELVCLPKCQNLSGNENERINFCSNK